MFSTGQVIPVKKDLCSQTFTTTYHMICIYQVIPGASQINPDLVTNSGPIPDHFWHLGPDPDQVRNSGPYWSHCIWSVLVLPQKHKSKSFKFEKEKIHYLFNGEPDDPPGGSNVPCRPAAVWASDEAEAGFGLQWPNFPRVEWSWICDCEWWPTSDQGL